MDEYEERGASTFPQRDAACGLAEAVELGSCVADLNKPDRFEMHIEVVDNTRSLPAPMKGWVRDRALAAAEVVGGTGASGEVRVRLIDDQEMAAAHARHCGDDSTTDVLTFDLRGTVRRAANLTQLDTDVLICVDEAKRQAEERGHAVEREILLYVVHAMLHCLGYDDHEEPGYAAMHAEEDRVLEVIGVGRTFGVSARGDGAAGSGTAGGRNGAQV